VNSLRARLFVSTLAALAVTLALTIAISAFLTRRQVDRSQAANIARRADDLAQQRRQDVNYKRQNVVVGGVRQMIEPRRSFRTLVPNVNTSSDGEVVYQGQKQLYSYRTLPHLGLLLLRPRSPAAWRPFLGDLLLAGLAGGRARRSSFVRSRALDHSSDSSRRRRHESARRRREPRAAANGRHDRARIACPGVQPDDRATGRVARGRTRLSPLGESRAEDAAHGHPRLLGRFSPTARSSPTRRRASSRSRRVVWSAWCAICSTLLA